MVSGPVPFEGSSVHPPKEVAWLWKTQPPLGHCWAVNQLMAGALAVCPTALSAVKTRPWV